MEKEDVLQNYFTNLKYVTEQQRLDKKNPDHVTDPITQYIWCLDKKHRLPLAHPFKKNKKFLRDEESKEILKRPLIGLKSFTMNADMAEALATNLKMNNHLSILVLRNTKLNSKTFKELFSKIPPALKKIDISMNPSLREGSYKALCKQLLDSKSKLESLICDGNKFGDHVCEILCDMICALKSFTMLNFSRCHIGDPGAYHIARVLISRYINLKCLVIHWNNIKEKGSIALAKAIKYNRILQIFDASFNCFGHSVLKRRRIKEEVVEDDEELIDELTGEPIVKPPVDDGKPVDIPPEVLEYNSKPPDYNDEEYQAPECYTRSASKWGKALIDNKTLIHVDFSYNNFRTADVAFIGEALLLNHTLLGIHLDGS